MARLDQGSNQELAEPIELDEFLSAVIDQVRPLAEAKSITLLDSLPPNLLIRGQMDLLIRLFLNLLDNAIKYSPANGRVTIQAQKQEQGILIAIGDSGPGIAAAHLPHLFERFYRVEGDRARGDNRQSGAGLGLAIAYEIARKHGGKLSVQSEVGQGTTFFVQLPAAHSS
jgi:signal transduction histidine kinase